MERRAIWRHLPDSPRSVREDRNRLTARSVEGLSALLMIASLWLFLDRELWLAGLSALTSALLRIKVLRPSIGRLVEIPLPAERYPCTAEITRGDVVIGIDYGTVSFVEGWLHFEGLRTSFSLSRDDVDRRRKEKLWLRDGGEVAFVVDERLCPSKWLNPSWENRFRTDLDRWYRIQRSAKGAPILPPSEVHRSGVIRAWIELGSSGLYFVSVLALSYMFSSISIWGYVVFFLFALYSLVDGIVKFLNFRRMARQ